MRDQVEKTVLKNIETRCTQAEAALRTLHGLRKNRISRDRKEDKDEDRKHKLKKVSKKHDEDTKHPPAVGAHGLARQDGVEVKGQSFNMYQVALHLVGQVFRTRRADSSLQRILTCLHPYRNLPRRPQMHRKTQHRPVGLMYRTSLRLRLLYRNSRPLGKIQSSSMILPYTISVKSPRA